jgi:hypothetical protein
VTWYLEGAATEEGPGANWTPPTIGNFMAREGTCIRRLREADASRQVAREAKHFHEKQALKYGVHTGRGLAHFKASLGYTKEGAGRLQEMFEHGGDPSHLNELPPQAIMKANKAAMHFHQKQAEKAGLDSDLGHAHIAAMEQHADIHSKAKALHQQAAVQQPKPSKIVKPAPMQASKKEALPGYSGKQSPVPVPKKSEQPSEDIRQNKPPIPLNPQDANKPGAVRQLQQNETMGAHAGIIKAARKRERAIRNFAREGGRGPYDDQECTPPRKVRKQMGDDLLFRARRTGEAGNNYVAPRYDKSHPEGFTDKRYSGLKNGVEGAEGGPGSGRHEGSGAGKFLSKELRKRGMKSRDVPDVTSYKKESKRRVNPRVMESNRDEDEPKLIDLREFYSKPSNAPGWRDGVTFSPGVPKVQQQESGLVIKEF